MRTIRQNVPGIVYHVISRFVDRSWFFQSDEERGMYLRLLGIALAKSDWLCIAYALMSNHIHLAFVAGREALAGWAKRAHTPFALWMNERHERLGPLFVRGPKDFAILPENEGSLIAYIHNNPVRAKVVSRARHSTWTSHAAYLGLAPRPEWLYVDDGLARTGFVEPKAFDAWVNATPGESGSVDLRRVRRAARKHGAIEVATPTGGEPATIPLVINQYAHVRPNPRRVIQITADLLGVSEVELCSRRRSPLVVAGRTVAVHCGNALGIAGCDLAAALAVSPQAVSRISQRSLDAAMRPVMDAALTQMRQEIRRLSFAN